MTKQLAWTILLVAGLFEVAWAVGMKYTAGFTRLWPTVLTVIAMAASMYLLGVAARWLPLGTAYASWTGIGVIGTSILGIYLFQESREPLRLLCIALILVGIAGLKLTARG